MERRSPAFALPLLALLLLSASGEAPAAGGTTYEFLRMDVGARAAGMAGTFLTVTDDPTALFYNPAALATYKQNAYGQNDVRLLTTLANAMSVALQNAQSFKAEQERAAELQIINSIQQGLAAELDFQAIVDLVGDKLREVFDMGDIGINWYDEKANLMHYLYTYEHGIRITLPSRAPSKGGIFERQIKTRQPVIFNTLADYTKFNATLIPGTDQGKSYVSVPIISSDRLLGAIDMENYERENAPWSTALCLSGPAGGPFSAQFMG